jgi:hypothetical protein
LLGKDATEANAASLVERLQQAGHITIGEKDFVTHRDEQIRWGPYNCAL